MEGTAGRAHRSLIAAVLVLTMLVVGLSSALVTYILTDDAQSASAQAVSTTPVAVHDQHPDSATTTVPPTTAVGSSRPAEPSRATTSSSTSVVETPAPTLPVTVTGSDGRISYEEQQALDEAAAQLRVTNLRAYALLEFTGNITCLSTDGSRDFTSSDALYASILDTWEWVRSNSPPSSEAPLLEPWEDAWWEMAAASMMCRDRLPEGAAESIGLTWPPK